MVPSICEDSGTQVLVSSQNPNTCNGTQSGQREEFRTRQIKRVMMIAVIACSRTGS